MPVISAAAVAFVIAAMSASAVRGAFAVGVIDGTAVARAVTSNGRVSFPTLLPLFEKMARATYRPGGSAPNGTTASACVRNTVEDAIADGFRPIVPRETVGDRILGAVEWNLFDIDAKFGDVEPLEKVLAYLKSNDIG